MLLPYMEAEKAANGGGGGRESAGRILMATVKGDVHDIGKNIVGVVLACNNYEIIDLGVMVPATKILETAKAEEVDIIGLSGLITPSLDEMAHVAAEMERDGLRHPAADRRRDHQPRAYGGEDPSRATSAGRRSTSPTPAGRWAWCRACSRPRRRRPTSPACAPSTRKLAEAHARAEADKQRLPLAAARANAPQDRLGRLRAAAAVASSARGSSRAGISPTSPRYIDWTPFFQTWELKGRYPKILEDEAQGAAARQLFDDAQAMLRADHRRALVLAAGGRSASGRRTRSATTSGSSPTRAAASELATFFTLRQQRAKRLGQENVALADFVAPVGAPDYVGGFVVTAGIEEVAIAERFERANDDYSSILVKALADRFAEAFAERLHERVRREFWGYAPDEAFAPEELIAEPYRGIRPAPGYPAQPDHTEKAHALPPARRRARPPGSSLTESFAMWPGSSVSGLYLVASRTATTSAWPRSSATRSRTTPAARACRRGGRALAGAGPELHARQAVAAE